MRTSTKFVIADGKLSAIYSDKDAGLLRHFSHAEFRASHVDPLVSPKWYEWLRVWHWAELVERYRAFQQLGNGYWYVQWLNKFRSWGISVTDEIGKPFKTKHEAELYEVERLNRDYFFTVPANTSIVVSALLDREARKAESEAVTDEPADEDRNEDLIPFDSVSYQTAPQTIPLNGDAPKLSQQNSE